MPASVFLLRRLVSEVVLLAQFIGDGGRGRIHIARIADDFGLTAAVVRHFTQRRDVDAVGEDAAGRSAALPAENLKAPAWARRERERHRQPRWPGPRWRGVGLGRTPCRLGV